MSFLTKGESDAYLRTYYAGESLDGEDTFLLQGTMDGLRLAATPTGEPLTCIELGCGPVLAWAMCAGVVADRVWLAEASTSGREAVLDWLRGADGAFDWDKFAGHVAVLTAGTDGGAAAGGAGAGADGSTSSDALPAAPAPRATSGGVQAALRGAVVAVLDARLTPGGVDLTHVASPGPEGWAGPAAAAPVTTAGGVATGAGIPERFRAVVMHSVADAITETVEAFAELVRGAAALVAPGGVLVMSANTDVDEWRAEGKAFRQVRLSADQVTDAVVSAGLTVVMSRLRSKTDKHTTTETDNTFVLAARRPAE